MAGLALGATWTDRFHENPSRRLLTLLLDLSLLAFMTPWLLALASNGISLWPGRRLVAGLIFLAGVGDGASFPLLPLLHPTWRNAGGWLYAADLLGACLAGFLTSSALLPATGLNATMLAAGMIVLAALALLPRRIT